jgi:DNA repair exonuclease SbcCD ATPase subunit
LPPRCREECEELRAELQRTEEDANRRLRELDTELNQCRKSLEDLRIEYEDVEKEKKQWQEWHDEATDELITAQDELMALDRARRQAEGFVSAPFAQVGATEHDAANLMSRLSCLQQVSADDLRAVEQWAHAQVCSIEFTCYEAVSGLETEAEARHRIAMQEAAETHLKNSSAAIVRERALEEELCSEGARLRTEEGYLLGAQGQFEEQQRTVAAQQAAAQELAEQLQKQYTGLVHLEAEVDHWCRAEAVVCLF